MQRERRKLTTAVRFDYVTFATLGKWLEWKGIRIDTKSDVVHEATEALVQIIVEKGVVPELTPEQAVAWLASKGFMPVRGQRGHASIMQHAAKHALTEEMGDEIGEIARPSHTNVVSDEEMEKLKTELVENAKRRVSAMSPDRVEELKLSLAGGRNEEPGGIAKGPAPRPKGKK